MAKPTTTRPESVRQEPRLANVSIQISIAADDGYRCQAGFDTKRGASPKAALIDAIDELTRLTALYERAGGEAVTAAQAAGQRVADWREGQSQ